MGEPEKEKKKEKRTGRLKSVVKSTSERWTGERKEKEKRCSNNVGGNIV